DRRDGRRSEGVHEAVDGDAETADRRRHGTRRRSLPGKREIVSAHEMRTTKIAKTTKQAVPQKARRRWFATDRIMIRSQALRQHCAEIAAGLCVLTPALLVAQTAVPRLPPAPPNPPAPSVQAPADPGYAALIATCKTPPPARGGFGRGGGARGAPPTRRARSLVTARTSPPTASSSAAMRKRSTSPTGRRSSRLTCRRTDR